MLNKYSRVATLTAASILLLGAIADPVRSQATASSSRVGNSRLLAAGATPASNYQTLYVNPDTGSDQAQGIANQPVQTVTRALEIATPNTVIVLAPGKYTQASGEVFPLQLKPGVTIQGTPGERNRTAIIEGGGNFNSPSRSQQNVAVVAADRAGIAQVAISNPNGYGVWVESASPTILESAFVGSRQTGIYVTDGSPRVQGSYFSGNRIAGLVVFGASRASIERNTFEGTGDAIRVVEGATPAIVGNQMTNNDAGLVLIGDANPVIQDNRMEGNRRNEVVKIANSTQGGLSALPALTNSATSAEVATSETTIEVSSLEEPIATNELPPAARSQTNLTLSSAPPVELASEIGENADVVPGDRLGLTQPRPAIEAPPDIRSRLLEQAEAEAQAEQRQEEVSTEGIDNAADQETFEADAQPELEADTVPGEIPAGAPGSALAALQSGLPNRGDVPPIVGLGPRAVTGGNPDSPVLPPRNRRRDRTEREEEARPEIRRPVNNNRLAVPSSNIPVGSGGSATVFSPPSGGVGSPPAPPSRAQSLGLYYRVFVEASDPFVQDDVREVVPDSFRTRFEGRTMMQVGAFPTEEEAEERKRLLERNNFDAQVEYIR